MIAKPWLHLKKRGFFDVKKGLFNGEKGAFFPSPLPFCDDGIKNFNSPLPLSDDFQCLHSKIIRRLSFGDRYLFRAILPCPMMPAAKVLSLWSLHHLPAGRPAEIRFHIHSGFVSCFRREEKPPQRPFPHYRNGLFFCFIECERHGDKVSKSGENIRESSCTSLNFFRHSSCPDWACCLFRAMIFL